MKGDANFLVVRLRPPGWRLGLFVPVPLFVLEDALEAVTHLVRVWSWLGGRQPRATVRVLGTASRCSLSELLHIPRAFIRGLRSQGSFTIAEVRDGSTHVSVRLV